MHGSFSKVLVDREVMELATAMAKATATEVPAAGSGLSVTAQLELRYDVVLGSRAPG
jgi:hypothetical protein